MKNGKMIRDFADIDQLLTYDREHIWHPYTSPTDPLPVYPVVSAHGVRLTLANGRELIDGMASWWCVIHGYNNPVLNEALCEQVNNMAHVMFGGITHPQSVALAAKLVDLTPEPLQKVFFCDSGSVSVEVAIKMALQFWQAQGRIDKNKLLTIKGGYHGDTFGAMSVCDPITGMHHLFSGSLMKQVFADAPISKSDKDWQDSDLDSFQKKIEKKHQQIAAVILEPIVQGAGGMRFYAPEFLRRVRSLCDQYEVLLIVDEIATGFGRTGKLFACEHAAVAPDIMCLGKALTGGYMSFGATLTTEKVSSQIGRDGGVFMHGPTFMANPLACSVANASIDLLMEKDWQADIERIESRLRKGLHPCLADDQVQDVRVLGGIGVVEMKAAVDVTRIQKFFVDCGVWIRPFGKLIYLMPPYIIDNDDMDTLTGAIVKAVKERRF